MIIFLVWPRIVHDSYSVSWFGNHGPDSSQYFLKCFTVHAEHFIVSGSVLYSQFFHQFLQSTFISPFDPFPCRSFLPPTLSRFIFCTVFHKIDYQKTCCHPLSSQKIHTFTSLPCRTPFSVHIFMRKELGSRCSRDFAYVTAGELLSTINYCHLSGIGSLSSWFLWYGPLASATEKFFKKSFSKTVHKRKQCLFLWATWGPP